VSDHVANSDVSLQRLIGDLREQFRLHKYLKVRVIAGTKRSLSQNDISHAWYEQVSRELREDTALGVKCESKLVCGVPILRAEDAEFRATYDRLIRPMGYADKLELMKVLPVSSLMTKAQLTQYLEAMQTHWNKRGVLLQFPEVRDVA
jgi:hypothetical protein